MAIPESLGKFLGSISSKKMGDLEALEDIRAAQNKGRVEEAFRYIFKKYYVKIVKYLAFEYKLNIDVAEEISGLTFLKIRQNPNFNGGSFIKWAETIAHNAYVDYLRTLELDPSDLTKQNKIKATKEAHKKTLIDKTKTVIDDLGSRKTILPYIEPIDESRVYIDQISLTNYGDDSDDDTQAEIFSMGLNSESLIDLQDCLFKKQGRLAETYPKIARVISYLLEGLANEEIAELMDNKSKNFAEFISYSRKQFMHYAEECFE